MKKLKYFYLVLCCFIVSQSLFASTVDEDCDQAYIRIENCISTATWPTWGSGYTAVRTVCDLPLDNMTATNSCGSVLYSNDEVCMYEVDNSGALTQVYCDLYANLNFTPTAGKQYKMVILHNGGAIYEVKFDVVNCMNFSASNPGSNNSCLREGTPIEFTLPFDIDYDCYYDIKWEFGDGTVQSHGGTTESHTYNFNAPLRNPCRNFTVKLTMTPWCNTCPEYTYTKTIKVCRICQVSGEDTQMHDLEIALSPNPTGGPFNVVLHSETAYQLEYIFINDMGTGEPIFETALPADFSFPYEQSYDLSGLNTGYYSITVLSATGETRSAAIFKE